LVKGAFVVAQPQPRQPLKDGLDGFLDVALGVSVINAKDEPALVVAGVKPVIKCCTDPADVQITSWAGGKAG